VLVLGHNGVGRAFFVTEEVSVGPVEVLIVVAEVSESLTMRWFLLESPIMRWFLWRGFCWRFL